MTEVTSIFRRNIIDNVKRQKNKKERGNPYEKKNSYYRTYSRNGVLDDPCGIPDCICCNQCKDQFVFVLLYSKYQSLINKKGKQYATVKFKTYDMTGWWNTGAKVRITLRDGNGRYITSWIAKGGDTFKLGDDHRTYRIYVSYYDNPGNNFISQGNNFTNLGSAYKWTISNAKNCTIR